MPATIKFKAPTAITSYDVLVGVPKGGQLTLGSSSKGEGVHLVLSKPTSSKRMTLSGDGRFSLFWFVLGKEKNEFTIEISGISEISEGELKITKSIAIGESLGAGHRYFKP